jgi:hypothetical protein
MQIRAGEPCGTSVGARVRRAALRRPAPSWGDDPWFYGIPLEVVGKVGLRLDVAVSTPIRAGSPLPSAISAPKQQHIAVIGSPAGSEGRAATETGRMRIGATATIPRPTARATPPQETLWYLAYATVLAAVVIAVVALRGSTLASRGTGRRRGQTHAEPPRPRGAPARRADQLRDLQLQLPTSGIPPPWSIPFAMRRAIRRPALTDLRSPQHRGRWTSRRALTTLHGATSSDVWPWFRLGARRRRC